MITCPTLLNIPSSSPSCPASWLTVSARLKGPCDESNIPLPCSRTMAAALPVVSAPLPLRTLQAPSWRATNHLNLPFSNHQKTRGDTLSMSRMNLGKLLSHKAVQHWRGIICQGLFSPTASVHLHSIDRSKDRSRWHWLAIQPTEIQRCSQEEQLRQDSTPSSLFPFWRMAMDLWNNFEYTHSRLHAPQ